MVISFRPYAYGLLLHSLLHHDSSPRVHVDLAGNRLESRALARLDHQFQTSGLVARKRDSHPSLRLAIVFRSLIHDWFRAAAGDDLNATYLFKFFLLYSNDRCLA